MKSHFDKHGNYIFKNHRYARVASIARSVGATMSGGITFVQDGDSAGGSYVASGTTKTVLGSNATSSNSVVLAINVALGTVSSVTSTFGTFVRAEQSSNYPYTTEVWWCASSTGGGDQVTVNTVGNYGGSGSWIAQASEWTGIGSVGSANALVSTVSTFSCAYTFSSANGDDLGVGNLYFAAGITQGTTTGLSSPWTYYNAGIWNISNGVGVAGWMISTDTASHTASWLGGYAGGGSLNNECVGVVFTPSTAPSAPNNTTPTNGAYADSTTNIPFAAIYNSTDYQNQNAYAFRIKVSGAAYYYWNATSNSLQSGIVWNTISTAPGASFGFTLPSGQTTNGEVLNWSFASQEASRNLQGPFASDSTLSTAAAPVTAVTAPSGSVTSNTPIGVWANTLPSGDTQATYQVIIESGTFTTIPGSGTQLWASGVITSTSLSVATGAVLPVGTSMRYFVQITDAFGATSAWAYSNFSVAADVPASPSIIALNYNDPTTGLPEVKLIVQGNDNQLTANQSSLELGTTAGWQGGANTTMTVSTTWAQDGSHSLRLQAGSAGSVSCITPVGASGVPCIPGQMLRAMASFHSPTTVRSCEVAFSFYNSAGTLISQPSTFVNSTLTGNGGQGVCVTLVPLGAAFVALYLIGTGLSSSELLYIDCAFLGPNPFPGNSNQLTATQASFEGATTGWTAGANTTLSDSSTWAMDGSDSMAMTASSAGTVSANTPNLACIPGMTISGMAFFHSPTTPRLCSVYTFFFDTNGNPLTAVASTNVNSTLAGNGGQAFFSAVVPAGAVYMTLSLEAQGLSSGEVVYVDCASLGYGTSTVWTPGGLYYTAWSVGGFVGASTLTITRSDGVEVRGAGWSVPATVPFNEMMTIYDVETPPAVPLTYSAVISAIYSGVSVSSSPQVSSAVTVSPTKWDIMDPNNIATGTQIDWTGDSRTFDQPEQQGNFNAFQRANGIVVRGTMLARTPVSLVLQFGDDKDAAWQAFESLRQQQVTVQLRGDMPGDFFYVVLGPSQPIATARTIQRLTSPSRSLSIAVTVVDRP